MRKAFTYLHLLLLCIAFVSIANAQVSEEEQRQLRVERALQEQAARATMPQLNKRSAPTQINDNDFDGMDDDWETANGFDPNDPADAQADEDGDQVINLFEFQLGTDHNDASSPVFVEFSPSSDLDLLDATLNAAGNGGAFVRLSQGIYPFNYLEFFEDSVVTIMVQGGWNDDFSDYNPDVYTTTIDAENEGEAFYFSSSFVGQRFVRFATVIDGLTITNAEDGLFGAVTHLEDALEIHTSIANCKIVGNSSLGCYFSQSDSAGTVSNVILNTLIADNTLGGCEYRAPNNNRVNQIITNATIVADTLFDAAIDGFTLGSESSITSVFTNSIVIGRNGPKAFDHGRFEDIEILFQYSLTDSVDEDIAELFEFGEGNLIGIDPLFSGDSDFSLSAESPCVDAGLDMGLAYSGSAPDMGAIEFGLNTSINRQELSADVYPTLLSAGASIFATHGYDQIAYQLVDAVGKKIDIYVERNGSTDQINIPNHLISGMYYLLMQADNKIASKKIMIK